LATENSPSVGSTTRPDSVRTTVRTVTATRIGSVVVLEVAAAAAVVVVDTWVE
jgi:hypothetical protein